MLNCYSITGMTHMLKIQDDSFSAVRSKSGFLSSVSWVSLGILS